MEMCHGYTNTAASRDAFVGIEILILKNRSYLPSHTKVQSPTEASNEPSLADAMKGSNNRVVIIAIALTSAATLYSLSELHRISAEHTANDKRTAFDTHSESGSDKSQGEDTVHGLDSWIQISALCFHRVCLPICRQILRGSQVLISEPFSCR